MRLRIVTGRFVYYISVFQAQTFPEACVGKGVGGMPRASSGCAAALRADRVGSAGQMLQFPGRLIVCNGRVNLRGADVFMAEKFADGFDRHALRERYGRGESVAGDVEREKTVDIRSADDFFSGRRCTSRSKAAGRWGPSANRAYVWSVGRPAIRKDGPVPRSPFFGGSCKSTVDRPAFLRCTSSAI